MTTYSIQAQRPSSEQLVDLHVYLLPRESWNEKYHSSYNESISEAMSAGFVRVWPELTVCDLRTVIDEELGHDILPSSYVFLRSVGRCMTQIKPKQETELKCKSFLPPTAWSPEIVVLEVPRENLGVAAYQSFPGYSPRHDTTQPMNGMPTHFPQLSNHDRMDPQSGQIPPVQQPQKEETLVEGMSGKSGRPDAYTNNTNEDSGIAEPTAEEYDPDFDRRRSDGDNQYYNNEGVHQRDRPQDRSDGSWRMEDDLEERGIEEERQRQAEILRQEQEDIKIEEEQKRQEEERRRQIQREEERKRMEDKQKEERREEEKKREEHRIKEEERKREEEKRELGRRKEEARKLAEKRKQEEGRKELQKKEEEWKEVERQKQEEIERVFEEGRQRKIAERIKAERERFGMPYDDEDDVDVPMATDFSMDSGRHIPTDAQLRRRAEDDLRDYEPQPSWQHEREDEEMSDNQFAPGPRRNRVMEDTEMMSPEAVQDGLKRVHLTPEVLRRAKVGKVQDPDEEEDIYEIDHQMADFIEQLEAARQERMHKEKEREAMIKKAKNIQAKTYERRYKSRDYWKKRYFDEKKRTTPLEEQVNRLKTQMEVMHRKLLNHLEGKKGKGGARVKGPPSKKNDHKINILKMEHELDEIRRQVDNSRMKLTTEVKLRNQAEAEVRSLKTEVTQRKINLTLTRNQKLAALKTGDKLLAKTPIPAVGQASIYMSAKR